MTTNSSINDPTFLQKLIDLSSELQMPYEDVYRVALECLQELKTTHLPLANIAGFEVAQFVLGRGYDKTIDVNAEEINAITKLTRHNTIAFVMTHKTYIDMFVLAVVLGRHGIPFPYTFAGINMDFLGFGQLARQNGVIFIRRSFKEDKIYKAALRYFISTKVEESADFMWAIEGTRSRTGKLVWPKVGILKYIREAEADVQKPVKYVPVSIVYDLIPDVKEMTQESKGVKKKKESLQWFLSYVNKMSEKFGKISIRFGQPVEANAQNSVDIITEGVNTEKYTGKLSKFAIELVHSINKITPVTTASLICISLLSKFSLTKVDVEHNVLDLMTLIEFENNKALVDRGKPIGESVQKGLRLLKKANIILQHGTGLHAKYVLNSSSYLEATYYANMSVHHLYHRAFIELALLHTADKPKAQRQQAFWVEIMKLRALFKFEFFYSQKDVFSAEIEQAFSALNPDWEEIIESNKSEKMAFIKSQKVLLSPVVLQTYMEAYRVSANSLLNWDIDRPFSDKEFMEECQFLSEEMHWQGRLQRIESVAPPFLINSIRLLRNLGLIPTTKHKSTEEIKQFAIELNNVEQRIKAIQQIVMERPKKELAAIPFERQVVPGSSTEMITRTVIQGESGPHIGAFFDLDRTLIKNFSAKEFFQTRLFSGKMTRSEIVSQFSGVLVYAMGNNNFAGLAAVSAQGVKGVKEEVFLEVGEDVYHKHLAGEIYPESRALVNAHIAQGHTVAIISAATPYQVTPIARDLGIEHIMCTQMEVENGVFTGKIVEPACWGEGKAIAARDLAAKHHLDLAKSYFYTDSAADVPLMEIVGHPISINPDVKLSALSFQNNWPVYRFDGEQRPGVSNLARTAMAFGSLFPAIFSSLLRGAITMSWDDGVNSLLATVGDLVTKAAGIELSVKGEEHLWSHRPAVFIFNHQSNVDMFIVAKLIRKNATGVAKKELKSYPIIGQLLQAGGAIFIDRKNREKAIDALKPAVDILKNGTSIIIFPEGTRSKDYKMGPFKKGAFHMAMQAGVPIVPVVIKNAHDAMPRGSNIFRPSAINVVAHAPVSTKKWNTKNLNGHVKKIRQIFLDELGQEDQEA